MWVGLQANAFEQVMLMKYSDKERSKQLNACWCLDGDFICLMGRFHRIAAAHLKLVDSYNRLFADAHDLWLNSMQILKAVIR